eukprot:ANDGO_01591.mRNA.1 hypothetical protein
MESILERLATLVRLCAARDVGEDECAAVAGTLVSLDAALLAADSGSAALPGALWPVLARLSTHAPLMVHRSVAEPLLRIFLSHLMLPGSEGRWARKRVLMGMQLRPRSEVCEFVVGSLPTATDHVAYLVDIVCTASRAWLRRAAATLSASAPGYDSRAIKTLVAEFVNVWKAVLWEPACQECEGSSAPSVSLSALWLWWRGFSDAFLEMMVACLMANECFATDMQHLASDLCVVSHRSSSPFIRGSTVESTSKTGRGKESDEERDSRDGWHELYSGFGWSCVFQLNVSMFVDAVLCKSDAWDVYRRDDPAWLRLVEVLVHAPDLLFVVLQTWSNDGSHSSSSRNSGDGDGNEGNEGNEGNGGRGVDRLVFLMNQCTAEQSIRILCSAFGERFRPLITSLAYGRLAASSCEQVSKGFERVLSVCFSRVFAETLRMADVQAEQVAAGFRERIRCVSCLDELFLDDSPAYLFRSPWTLALGLWVYRDSEELNGQLLKWITGLERRRMFRKSTAAILRRGTRLFAAMLMEPSPILEFCIRCCTIKPV